MCPRGPQARSVIDALSRHDGFVGAQRLHLEMRTAGSRVGLTTVYKARNAAAADGYVDTVVGSVVGSGEGALFRRREGEGARRLRTVSKLREGRGPRVAGSRCVGDR